MNLFVKSFALAAMFSIATATTASANHLESAANNASSNTKLIEFHSLIAQKYPNGLLKETRSRRFIDEMIMLRMRMIEAAEQALQSPNPDIKNMAQEVIKTSNTDINKMMEMRKKYSQYEDG